MLRDTGVSVKHIYEFTVESITTDSVDGDGVTKWVHVRLTPLMDRDTELACSIPAFRIDNRGQEDLLGTGAVGYWVIFELGDIGVVRDYWGLRTHRWAAEEVERAEHEAAKDMKDFLE